jgi:hypothetical protein
MSSGMSIRKKRPGMFEEGEVEDERRETRDERRETRDERREMKLARVWEFCEGCSIYMAKSIFPHIPLGGRRNLFCAASR